MKRALRSIVIGAVVAVSACRQHQNVQALPCTTTALDGESRWFDDNRAALDRFMAEHGRCGAQSGGKAPVAVFDFDNTVIKGDIGDGVFFYLLERDRIRRPPSWAATSKHLSPAALASLDQHCPLGRLSDPLPTSSTRDCLTAILCIYWENAVWTGKSGPASAEALCRGDAAWAMSGNATADTIEPAYAWSISLQAGYTSKEIGNAALAAFAALSQGQIGSRRTLGHISDFDGYLRVNEPIRDLMQKLRDNGFDVWLSSATTRFAVEAIAAAYLPILPDHVIGAAPQLDESGRGTYGFEGCGPLPDGNQDIINYKKGKRCWLNKRVFGVTDRVAQLETPTPIAFGAGDSDTDIFFLRDARHLRLAINRNKKELMCHAYANVDGKWIVNPLFTEPRGERATGYDCSEYGLPTQRDVSYCRDKRYTSEDCSRALR